MSDGEYKVQCPFCLEEFIKASEFEKLPRHDFKKPDKALDCPGSFTQGTPIIAPLGRPDHS